MKKERESAVVRFRLFRTDFLFILLHYSLNIYEVCYISVCFTFRYIFFFGFPLYFVLFLFFAPCALFVFLSVFFCFSFCLLTPNTNSVLFAEQRSCCTLRLLLGRVYRVFFWVIYFMTRDAVANI